MGEEVTDVKVELRDGRRRGLRPRSASYIALRSAVYQLTRLNDFSKEKIGAGFYADVFKVKHHSTGEVMVLKMNKSRKTSKLMLSEIQLLNRLSHPNILGFRGSCVHEGQLHALTEYINGGSLEDLLLKRHVYLPWSVRVKLALDIAKGMAYLHSKGVFHRDLTSKNCLIQHEPKGDLRAVVADFGLAAKIKYERRRSYTEIVGSPYWMAPECLKGKQYCEKADVFSFGIILAEIMARIPADPDFMPRTTVFGMDFDALKKLCFGCPDEMWQLMSQCCQLDPDDRPNFEESSRILGEVQIDQEDFPDLDLRSCISEPILRLQDSDEEINPSSADGEQSYERRLDSLGSVESISSGGSLDGGQLLSGGSGGSSRGEGGGRGGGGGGGAGVILPECTCSHMELKASSAVVSQSEQFDGGQWDASGRSRDSGILIPSVVKEKIEEDYENERDLSPLSDKPTSPLSNPVKGGLRSEEWNGSIQTLVAGDNLEECTSPTIKCSDSGIDPGESFPAITAPHLSSLSDGEKDYGAEEDSDGGLSSTQCGRKVALGDSEGFSYQSTVDPGDHTPLDGSPPPPPHHSSSSLLSHEHSCSSLHETPSRENSEDCSQAQLISDSSPSFITPSGVCTSPLAHGWDFGDYCVRLPSPSTPWAPPCSPLTPNKSHWSLPSSPVSARRFRFSQEIPEDQILTDFYQPPKNFSPPVGGDLPRFQRRLSPMNCHCVVKLSSAHESSCPRNVGSRHQDSLCANLDQEYFETPPSSRTRSHSNPAHPIRKQSANFTLTLERLSPDSAHRCSCSNPASSYYKGYRIRLKRDCRLSSSTPNLSLVCASIS